MALPDKLIANFICCIKDSSIQVQPAGVDLTVCKVYAFTSPAYIGFKDRKLAGIREIEPVNGIWRLGPGAYKVMFNEVVKVPNDVVGLCFPRSSLLRSGVIFTCTVWDPGYVGRGEGLLTVLNPQGLELEVSARVAQLVFIKLMEKPSRVYEGAYKGENI
ncbi:MAG: deoxyuridine 5'-triphosphate nucleotidohydrolase [Desulfurococcales archaeon]|nr:deoxyuridine 5'-triphosphate nucleotidohydrolase [Desulfurococcales archaeon]